MNFCPFLSCLVASYCYRSSLLRPDKRGSPRVLWIRIQAHGQEKALRYPMTSPSDTLDSHTGALPRASQAFLYPVSSTFSSTKVSCQRHDGVEADQTPIASTSFKRSHAPSRSPEFASFEDVPTLGDTSTALESLNNEGPRGRTFGLDSDSQGGDMEAPLLDPDSMRRIAAIMRDPAMPSVLKQRRTQVTKPTGICRCFCVPSQQMSSLTRGLYREFAHDKVQKQARRKGPLYPKWGHSLCLFLAIRVALTKASSL